ncbi:hypothetical protein SUNI508_07579 [Seiridium unicorne]|uniref:Uncharacterized protein n=1 Tax=Seiridium unicorne TaxID=138068 RepID=A0ABR2UWK4_9PEZI
MVIYKRTLAAEGVSRPALATLTMRASSPTAPIPRSSWTSSLSSGIVIKIDRLEGVTKTSPEKPEGDRLGVIRGFKFLKSVDFVTTASSQLGVIYHGRKASPLTEEEKKAKELQGHRL